MSHLLDVAIDSLGYRTARGFVHHALRQGASGQSFVWRELHRKGGLEAAYFRGAVPLVGFARTENPKEVSVIHRRLWNLSRVPLLIAATPDQVGAYSCFVPPAPDLVDLAPSQLRVARSGDEIQDVLREFTRSNVESGRVATSYGRFFSRKHRVDQDLLDNLRALRSDLRGEEKENVAIDALIGRSIFVRYFEDRGILSEEHLAELTSCRRFTNVLRSGTEDTYRLFASLEARFNGDVFMFDRSERVAIDDSSLLRVAEFFEGTNLATGQHRLWPYDFGVIPPELISSIYEQLLESDQKRDAAFYTPRFLVDLVLDEVLAWEDESQPQVLDPACGSGIFLAEAFRRLVFRATASSGEKLSFPRLVSILLNSIFGVDRNSAAVNVAAFGLYLALLEELDPPSAWRDAVLPKLVGRNLLVSDFFAEEALQKDSFDIIVGNPPWQSRLTQDAQTYIDRAGVEVADEQIAMVFLRRCGELLRSTGHLGLLMPAKALLHNKAKKAVDARRQLFRALEVETIVDLSPLRHGLFRRATAPAAIVVARRRTDEGGPAEREILHVVPRSSPLQKTVDGVVISQDDLRRVPEVVASSYPDVWKVFLWGGRHDLELITRLRGRYSTLEEVVKQRGWFSGRGFMVGRGLHSASAHLLGKRLVATQAIVPFAVLPEGISAVEVSSMERPRNPRLYEGPHILISRTFFQGWPAATYLEEDAVFTNGIFGIAGPSEDATYLKYTTALVNSSLSAYYHFLTSASWGVERDFIEANEHLTLPIPNPDRETLDKIVEIAQFASGRARPEDMSWRDELDRAVFAAYGLTETDVSLIHDALNVRLDQFRRRSKSSAFQAVTDEQFTAYSRCLDNALSDLVRSVRFDISVTAYSSTYVIASVDMRQQGDQRGGGPGDRAVDLLDALVDEAELVSARSQSPATVVQPSSLILDGDVVHLVKPNELRFWTSSAALGDAGDVVGAIAVGGISADAVGNPLRV